MPTPRYRFVWCKKESYTRSCWFNHVRIQWAWWWWCETVLSLLHNDLSFSIALQAQSTSLASDTCCHFLLAEDLKEDHGKIMLEHHSTVQPVDLVGLWYMLSSSSCTKLERSSPQNNVGTSFDSWTVVPYYTGMWSSNTTDFCSTTTTPDQCPGSFWAYRVGQDPCDSKSSRFHVDIIFRFCYHSCEIYSFYRFL